MRNLNSPTEGYKLFRRERQSKRGVGIAAYNKKTTDCKELPLRNSQAKVASLWVKIRVETNKRQLVVGVYYRPPNQGEPVDVTFFLQLQALILLGDF